LAVFQVCFLAVQVITSRRKDGIINATYKSCQRRGRTVLVGSFFQVSLSMSGSCKVVIGFRASELVFLTFLHSHVGKATYPCLAFLSGGFFPQT